MRAALPASAISRTGRRDRRQPWLPALVESEIIVSDERDVPGHCETKLGYRLQDANCDLAAAAHDSSGAMARIKFDKSFARERCARGAEGDQLTF